MHTSAYILEARVSATGSKVAVGACAVTQSANVRIPPQCCAVQAQYKTNNNTIPAYLTFFCDKRIVDLHLRDFSHLFQPWYLLLEDLGNANGFGNGFPNSPDVDAPGGAGSARRSTVGIACDVRCRLMVLLCTRVRVVCSSTKRLQTGSDLSQQTNGYTRKGTRTIPSVERSKKIPFFAQSYMRELF